MPTPHRFGRAARVAALCACLTAAAASAQNDLSVTAVTSPASGCALTAGENVTISLFNFGTTLPAGTSFNVSYTLSASPGPVTEMVVLGSPLLANSTFHYTFVTQANLSVPGTHTLDASVNLPGDVNPSNDVFSGYVVTNTAPSAGGSVAGPAEVCASGNSGLLTLSGHAGGVVRWEFSTDGGGTWVTISNTTAVQPFVDLAIPTLYRAIVQNGSCAPAPSAPAAIAVSPATVGGAVSSAPAVCGGAGSGTVTLSGHTGSVERWESSTDGGASWAPIANTTTSQGYAAITQTTLFRAVVKSGACANAASQPGTVPVFPATVAVSAAGPVCPGSDGNVASVPDLGPGVVYAWDAVGGTITGGADARVATFRASGSGPVELSVTATGPGGSCQAVGALSVPLTFSAGIQGPPVACVGSPANAASVPDAGVDAIYLWAVANGILTGGLGTPAVTFQPLGGEPFALQALVLAQGCIANSSLQLPLAPTPPAPTLVAPVAVESGVTGIGATALGDPADAFAWTLSAGTIDSGNGTPSLLFTAGAPGVAQLAVVETNPQGCSAPPVAAQIAVRAAGDAPHFFTLAPCRVVDTRLPPGPGGGPAIGLGEERTFALLGGACGVPGSAAALAVNVTSLAAATGTLHLGAGNEALPTVGLPLRAGRPSATQSIVRLATDGTGSVVVGHDAPAPVHVILDVVGWFQ